MEDNNNVPSTESQELPKGGGITQKGKNIAVKAKNGIKNGIGRALNELWKNLTLKQKAIVIAILIGIALIIIAAALLMSMISETSNVASNNVDDFMSKATDIDSKAKEMFEDKSSLLALKITDINNIYNKLVSEQKGGSETQNLMRYEIGEVEVSNEKERVVNVNDKLPLYKHILLTEKYNFNQIKWQKYSHTNYSNPKKITDFAKDEEKGLQYPDDSKYEDGSVNSNPTKLEKFMDLTLPYLQTWYIPLAMSNASLINGKEEESNRAPAFSYNIIKEAYSNIVVNWYEIKEHTLVTSYKTFDEVKCHYVIDGIEVIESVYENGDKSYSFNSYGNSRKIEDSRVAKNTATDNGLASGTHDPLKEDMVSEKDSFQSNFYIKEADVFDAKIINKFNYQVYKESDVENRRNQNSKSETTSEFVRAADNPQYRYSEGSISIDLNGFPTVAGIGSNTSLTNIYNVSNQDPSNSVRQRRIFTYSMTLPQYTDYENGLTHTVTRIWKDKLEPTGSETSEYNVGDLVAYNESADRKVKVTGKELCGEGYSGSSRSPGSFSEGTSTPTTEIKIGDYTYPVFAQGEYGGNISIAGCGLCSLTTVVGSITGRNVDPVSCANDTNWSDAKTLAQIADDLRSVYGIDAEATWWGNKDVDGSMEDKIRLTKTEVVSALQNNNPVIVLIKPKDEYYLGTSTAHYVTLVGLEGDTVIIANSARRFRK